MSTTKSTNAETVQHGWYLVDASDVPLGRLATRIATLLRGKHKANFTPHVDTGDFVVVLNAEKVRLTGNKLESKFYARHSGYPGGLKTETYKSLLTRKPEFAIEKAVKGMLPKNPLGRRINAKLKVYAGSVHPHAAQNPQKITV